MDAQCLPNPNQPRKKPQPYINHIWPPLCLHTRTWTPSINRTWPHAFFFAHTHLGTIYQSHLPATLLTHTHLRVARPTNPETPRAIILYEVHLASTVLTRTWAQYIKSTWPPYAPYTHALGQHVSFALGLNTPYTHALAVCHTGCHAICHALPRVAPHCHALPHALPHNLQRSRAHNHSNISYLHSTSCCFCKSRVRASTYIQSY